MNEITSKFISILMEEFENAYGTILRDMPEPPPNATHEQLLRHFGEICFRQAFVRGLVTGAELSQTYPD